MSVCEEEASKVFSVLVRGEIEVVDAARKNGIRSGRRSIVDGGRFVLFSSILQFSFGVDRLLIRSDMQSDEVYSTVIRDSRVLSEARFLNFPKTYVPMCLE